MTASKVKNLTQTASIQSKDDTISLAGSNIWFQSIQSQDTPPSRTTGSSVMEEKGSSVQKDRTDEGDVSEPSQKYWEEATAEYESINQASGPEVSSSIASAAKIFWHRPLKHEALQKKIEESEIPSNCGYLIPKRVNPEIWTKMGVFNRSTDSKLQEAQRSHSAGTTKMLRAASSLTGMFKENMPKEVREALTDLKDSMTLAGKLSQQLNQVRRDMIKPNIPKEFQKLASDPDETSDLLFGSSLCENIEKLKKESRLCAMLNPERKGSKRKFEHTKNSSPFLKPQRKVVYGQKYGNQNHVDQNRNYQNRDRNNNFKKQERYSNNNNKKYKKN